MSNAVLNELRRLRWRLAFAFTVTSTLVVMALLSLVVVLGTLEAGSREDQARQVVIILEQIGAQLAPLLAAEPIDSTRLSVLLTVLFERSGINDTGLQANVTVSFGDEPQFDLSQIGQVYILVLDPAGQLIGSTLLTDQPMLGRSFDVAALPGLAGLLALGDGDTPFLVDQRARRGIVVSPVGAEGRLGTLVYVANNLSDQLFEPREIVTALSATSVTLALAASLVGLVFGLVVASGLTRRLRAIERVTASWGRGDFSERLPARPADEIGQLSQQLNVVADQIERLIHERQQFATLEERNRLARDLHDSVKQHVFAASMNLGAADALWQRDPAAAAALANSAATAIGAARRELTDIIDALRPAALAQRDLPTALTNLAVQWSAQAQITVSTQIDPTIQLPAAVEEALFRIAQEALANVARHSGAGSAALSLQREAEATTLRISDDGRGFDPATTTGGMGLRSMRERAAAAGAEFTLHSDGAGSVVQIRLHPDLIDATTHQRTQPRLREHV
jgi:NarL family two-component system sensor histidine kinase LiaS